MDAKKVLEGLYFQHTDASDAARAEWLQYVHPDDRQRVDATIRAMLNSARNRYDIEYRVVNPATSEMRWICAAVDIERDENGSALRLDGAHIDITERKLREIEVQTSEKRLRTLADAVPQVIWTNDAGGTANYFNKRWFEYTGLSYEQSYGPGWEAVVHPDDAPASTDRWKKALAAGNVFDTEYRLRNAKGEFRWFIGRNVPLKDATDKVQGWFGTATEIEELKRAQQAVHESEARLRITMESATDYSIITMDALGFIRGWSRGAEQAFGYQEDEAIGQHASLIFTPEDRAAGIPMKELQKARAEGSADDERWHLRRGETRFYMSGVTRPIYDGVLTGFVKVARDMTDRKQAEEALRESEARYRALAEDLSRAQAALIATDQQKDQFIATLAHELRNPLAPVRSAMQLISMVGSSDPQVLWALDVVNRQTQGMTRLIDDLMDVSRISQNKLSLRVEKVDLGSVLRDAMETCRPLMQQQHQVLTVHLPHANISLNGDQMRLAQVFANLLDNAAKYTEPGGSIGLSAKLDGDGIEVRVRDSGIGIAPENIRNIFNLFAQVRTSRDRGKGGLGIGLSLVNQLVHMHGGTISAHSDGEGKGSEFVVRLPLANDFAVRTDDVEPAADEAPLAGVRVLVVDDNVDAADAFEALLSRQGSEVRTAYDGVAALREAQEMQPDVVLMDIGLPKLTGHEVAAQIRSSEWGKQMILIAVSGWGNEEDKRRSYAAGFERHLVKPVEPRRLMDVMSELLNERHSS